MTGDRCDGWITVHLRVILGNAHLESVLQTNVPEPYEAAGAAVNLKEGVPEGLSDTVRGRGNRQVDSRIRLEMYTQYFQ